MALPHLYYDKSTEYGKELHRAINDAERLINNLEGQQRLIAAMLGENDGSEDAHFATVASRFGFTANADAKAAKAEIDSSVTTCKAALQQLAARLG